MDVGEFIKKRRLALNLTMENVADIVGVAKSTVAKWENGKIESMKTDKVKLLAEALKVTPARIMGLDELQSKFSMSIPILGPIACGQPIEAVEDLEWIDVEEKCDYGLIAKGDSMNGAGIYDGDLILLDKTEHLDNGEIGAVCVGEDVTLKKFYHYPEKNRIVLRATNPDYEDQIYIGGELKDIRIIGRMKRLTRKY